MQIATKMTLIIFLYVSGVQPFYGEEMFCISLPQYTQMLNIIGNIDAIVTMILPFLLILVLNSLILYTVIRYDMQRERLTHQRTDSNSARELIGNHDNGHSKYSESTFIMRSSSQENKYHNQSEDGTKSCDRKKNKSCDQKKMSATSRSVLRMTKMLVIVSSSFLVLNLPSHSIRIYYFIVSWQGKMHLITHRLQSCLKLFR